jgi:hypothetical protein
MIHPHGKKNTVAMTSR